MLVPRRETSAYARASEEQEAAMRWFRSPWPAAPVLDGEPDWVFDPGCDTVLRTVDLCTGGASLRNGLALGARNDPDCRAREHQSRVLGPVLRDEDLPKGWLPEISAAEFQVFRASRTDKSA
jgi:hypothetical protein